MSERKEQGRIVMRGMGGFINPPLHPEHTQSVQIDLNRRADDRGGMCLSSAVDCDWLDDTTRSRAKSILQDWESNKPALESPEVQDWIHQVLGYFRNCYAGPEEMGEERWYADKLTIDAGRRPMEHLNTHCGVHHIRKYYPDFVPTIKHFCQAYWGQKPEKAEKST